MRRRLRVISLAFVLLLPVAPQTAAGEEWQFDDVGRVVAVSDIHGAFESMVQTLINASVIDDRQRWIAGDTHLVVVGDLLDRGPDSRQVMDLLIILEGQADAAGGMVHVLVGNHEVMNLVGDLRYVSSEEYAAFADEETTREREQWFQAFAQRMSIEEADLEVRQSAFDDKFPPGFFAHRRAFSATGQYGRWLLSQPMIVVINNTAFVHGGLSPMIGRLGLAGVNEGLHSELVAYVEQYAVLQDAGVLLPTDAFYDHDDLLTQYLPGLNTSADTLAAVDALTRLGNSDLHALDGPLWYRGNVACSRLIEQDRLEETLAAIDATRVVIGHTPTPSRSVLERFDGRVIEVDTGMLRDYYGGRGNALIIIGDVLAVVSQDSEEIRTLSPHPRQVGDRPASFMTAEAIENLLRTGEVGDISEDELKRKVVTISDGKQSVEALFAKRRSRGFYPDVAAYRLDRMLELDAVPVTVIRKVDGDNGSLQFLPRGWIDEPARAEGGRGGSASCPLNDQWAAMYVFDTLIYNEGRSLSRMTYNTSNWHLVLIGHQNAFSTRSGRPRYLESMDLQLSGAWLEKLVALSEESLEAQMDNVLDKRRRKALLERRDAIVRANQPEDSPVDGSP